MSTESMATAARLLALKNAGPFLWGELAQTLGISRSFLEMIKNGQRAGGPKTLRKIAAMERQFGISKPQERKPTAAVAALVRQAVALRHMENAFLRCASIMAEESTAIEKLLREARETNP